MILVLNPYSNQNFEDEKVKRYRIMKEILLKNLLSTFSLAFFSILSILYSYYSGYNFGLMAYSRINTADVIGFSNILPLVFVLFGYTALVAFYPSDKGKIKSNLRVVLIFVILFITTPFLFINFQRATREARIDQIKNRGNFSLSSEPNTAISKNGNVEFIHLDETSKILRKYLFTKTYSARGSVSHIMLVPLVSAQWDETKKESIDIFLKCTEPDCDKNFNQQFLSGFPEYFTKEFMEDKNRQLNWTMQAMLELQEAHSIKVANRFFILEPGVSFENQKIKHLKEILYISLLLLLLTLIEWKIKTFNF